jgi:hypothetical protein
MLEAFTALDACVLNAAALEEAAGGSKVGRWGRGAMRLEETPVCSTVLRR